MLTEGGNTDSTLTYQGNNDSTIIDQGNIYSTLNDQGNIYSTLIGQGNINNTLIDKGNIDSTLTENLLRVNSLRGETFRILLLPITSTIPDRIMTLEILRICSLTEHSLTDKVWTAPSLNQ